VIGFALQGQLSGCASTSISIARYSCSNKSAYGATCAFATLLFILQVRRWELMDLLSDNDRTLTIVNARSDTPHLWPDSRGFRPPQLNCHPKRSRALSV
jgi:hypothetical protein